MIEINLNDEGTLEALKLTDVMADVKEDLTPKPQPTHTFKRKFSSEEIERLARLSSTGNWEDGLSSLIDDTIASKVGKATIRGASYQTKVTRPNLKGEY